MPPAYVRSIRDEILYEYAKLICKRPLNPTFRTGIFWCKVTPQEGQDETQPRVLGPAREELAR